MKKGTRFEFYCILIGGILSMVVAINLLSIDSIRQAWSAYYVIISAALFSLAFRLSNRRNARRDAVLALLLGLFSLNPFPVVGGIVGLFKVRQPKTTQPTNSSATTSFQALKPQQKGTLPPAYPSRNQSTTKPAPLRPYNQTANYQRK